MCIYIYIYTHTFTLITLLHDYITTLHEIIPCLHYITYIIAEIRRRLAVLLLRRTTSDRWLRRELAAASDHDI